MNSEKSKGGTLNGAVSHTVIVWEINERVQSSLYDLNNGVTAHAEVSTPQSMWAPLCASPVSRCFIEIR